MAATPTPVLLPVTIAQAIANYRLNHDIATQSIADTSVNFQLALDQLQLLATAGNIAGIALGDTKPMTLSNAAYIARTPVLALVTTAYTLIVTDVLAANAAAAQSSSHITSFSVTDTTAQARANLATLAGASKLTSLTLTTTDALALSLGQLATSTNLLAIMTGSATVTVSDANVAIAATPQANARVVSFTVADTAAHVSAGLAALNGATKLRAIGITDQAALTLTAGQMLTFSDALSKLPASVTMTVSAATVASAADLQRNTSVVSFTVSDTAANIGAALEDLSADTKLTAITISNGAALSLSAGQYRNGTVVLGKIQGAWTVNLSGLGAADAAGAQNNARVDGFSISDTAVTIAGQIDAIAGMSKLTSITLTAGSTMTLTAGQLIADKAALDKIVTNYQITVTGVTTTNLTAAVANGHVTDIQIVDTAANVLSALGSLNIFSRVTSIVLTGGTTLGVTYGQFQSFGMVFEKLASPATLTVSGVTAAAARSVQANTRVSSFTVTDTAASVTANLNALSGDTKLASITLTGGSALSLTYTQFTSGAVALGRIGGSYTVNVSNVPAEGASAVVANSHVASFTVSGTLASIGNSLDQLEAAVKAGKLTAINVADTGETITITDAQYTVDAHAIALLRGVFTINHPAPVPAPASSATINLVWDAKALAAPAAFRSAVTYAAQHIQSLITNPITINLAVGYGEVAGSTLGGGVLGAAGPSQGVGVSYSQYKTLLASHITSPITQTIVSNMGLADPTNGGTIYVASAQEKALGMMSANNTALDGTMGFAADPNGTLFTYDPDARAMGGKYDLIGVVEHEITHAIGRIALGGTYGNWASAMDLFRFSSAGAHHPNAGGNAYFSIDNGATNLNWFAASSDLGDWASSAGNDANNAFSNGGVVNQLSGADMAQLNALGFATSGTPSANNALQSEVSATTGLNAPSLTFMGAPAILFADDEVPVIEANLDGIEEIAQFTYGVNELRIDLHGSGLSVFDTMVGGQHAIALTSATDVSHGIILIGMSANETASDLMSHHLNYDAGHAVIA